MKEELKAQISLTIDKNILNWIDIERHNMNRSSFINKVLEKKYVEFKKQFDWEKEDKKADEDIKKGKVKRCKTTDEAVTWLNS